MIIADIATFLQTLSEIQPYGNTRDGVIISQVVSGDRPSRPMGARWLQDQVWDMIMICWNERRELRWDIRTVYKQLSAASIQEIAESERGNRCILSIGDIGLRGYSLFIDVQTTRASQIIEDAPLQDLPAAQVEGNCGLYR